MNKSYCLVFVLGMGLLLGGTAHAQNYPPPLVGDVYTPIEPGEASGDGLLFTNTHFYVTDWGNIDIKVEVFNNYQGDFTKYWWKYSVTNHSYDPLPGSTNGFAGFETALPNNVPDIGDFGAPDGIPPWEMNMYSGQPVEWDLTNTNGAPVGGGTMPGETEVYSFTTAPRLVVVSEGWIHTWWDDIQEFIWYYPIGDGPEVPDVESPPDQELCCWEDPPEVWNCQVLPAGECEFIGGMVVINCDDCPPPTPTEKTTWGKVKGLFWE